MIAEKQPDHDQKSISLLVVDDEKNVCDTLREYFSRMGYDVQVAYDGIQAKDILHNTGDKVEVIILDESMPRLGGLGLMAHLVNEHLYHVSVVFLTGLSPEELKKRFFKQRSKKVIPFRFWTKPATITDLRDDVRKAARQVRARRKWENVIGGNDELVSKDIQNALAKCQDKTLFVGAAAQDLSETLNEIRICFNTRCFVAAIALAGKVLEICLKKYVVSFGVRCEDNWTIGAILKKIKEIGVGGKIGFPNINNIAGIINQYRIYAVHSKDEVIIPSREEAIMVVYGMLKVLNQTVAGLSCEAIPSPSVSGLRSGKIPTCLFDSTASLT